MNKKHIAVVGTGGVGGYFGFKLNKTNETTRRHKISFTARGETYRILKENGLSLLSPEHSENRTRPDEIYGEIAEIRNPHLVLICVKEYDLENVCRQLSGVISEETILLPMMNGADIHERIRSIIPHNIILPSCVYVASHIKEKGIIEHHGKPGKLIFGKDPEHLSEDVDWVAELIRESNIDYEFRKSALTDIWTKFIFIASVGLVSAKHNSSIGAVFAEEHQKKEAIAIMREVKLIADKKQIYLPEDIIQKTVEKAAAFPFGTPTSLQIDINSGKEENELELFAGTIIRYGAELQVDTSSTKKIYQQLKKKQLNI
ncbi:ketopantoate reductase family protein [Salegentibacter chungangensis]|uniref:2-dehydropantoate 2-reductase n=1 Tax=Salegentibacter chungangensis TaxID=1335724 RepID=A0ABW3NPY0_9FLAO